MEIVISDVGMLGLSNLIRLIIISSKKQNTPSLLHLVYKDSVNKR